MRLIGFAYLACSVAYTSAGRVGLRRRMGLLLLLFAWLPLVLSLLVFSLPIQAEALSHKISNQMQNHASPYLHLHSNDPVLWQEWGADAMALAKAQNKILFISIGYFSCHWCHVMQRESYSDADVARQMNANFIPVKVDRELNPALDAYLIEFVRRTRGRAGWPLNVFVTPEGYPIVGLTYAPKPQFIKVLQQVNERWLSDSESIKQTALQAASQLKAESKLLESELEEGLGERLSVRFLQQAMSIMDDLSGGFGEQNKFPMSPQLQFLLSRYEQKPDASLKAFMELTFDQMATQGLRDQIGGGFFRYTVDPDWQTPHFEKMLYDNALLATLYLHAASAFRRRDYEAIARETLDFMIRELKAKDGALMASLSAVDGAGVEGGFYLWEESTLRALLEKKAFEVVELLWNMEEKPTFEAGYLPRQVISPDTVAKKLGISTEAVMQTLASAQLLLFKVRQERHVPVDNKQLAAWNGLALSAFVAGAKLKQGGKYREAARQVRDYLVNTLWDGKSIARARHRLGQLGEETLEDYVFAAQGLFHWARLTNSKADLRLVRQWLTLAWQRFYSPTGWRLSSNSLLPYDFGAAVVDDGPLPSPSAALIKLTLEVVGESDQTLKGKAVAAMRVGHDLLQQQVFDFPGQIDAIIAYLDAKNAN